MLQATSQTTARTYPRPTPPPLLLCAWVKNPFFGKLDNELKYIRAEIWNVEGQTVTVREYDSICHFFTIPMSDVFKVHEVNPDGTTYRVFGNPPAAQRMN